MPFVEEVTSRLPRITSTTSLLSITPRFISRSLRITVSSNRNNQEIWLRLAQRQRGVTFVGRVATANTGRERGNYHCRLILLFYLCRSKVTRIYSLIGERMSEGRNDDDVYREMFSRRVKAG